MVGTHNSKNSPRNTPPSDQHHFIVVGTKNRYLFHHRVKTIHIHIEPISIYPRSTNSGKYFHHQNLQLPKLTPQDPFIYTKVNDTGLDATARLIFPHQDTVTNPLYNIQSLTFISSPTSCNFNRTLTPKIHKVTRKPSYRESPLPY